MHRQLNYGVMGGRGALLSTAGAGLALAVASLAGCVQEGDPGSVVLTHDDSSDVAMGDASEPMSTPEPDDALPADCENPIAWAEPRIEYTEDIITYRIVGSSADELRGQMNALGPMGFDGYTDPYFLWSYDGAGDCSTLTWHVSVEVGYDMPEWIPPGDASPALLTQWERFLDRLWCHEWGHAAIASEGAVRLLDELERIPLNSGCAAVQAAGEGVFGRVLADLDEAAFDYDAATMHGARMGATFP